MSLSSTNYRGEFTPETDGIVVDLAPHANKLMAYEDISADLSDSDEQRLVDYVKAAMKMSYDRISRRYDHWTEADRAHDVYVRPDCTAFREKAARRAELGAAPRRAAASEAAAAAAAAGLDASHCLVFGACNLDMKVSSEQCASGSR